MTRLWDRLLGRPREDRHRFDLGGWDGLSMMMSTYGSPDQERIMPTFLQFAGGAYSGNAVVFAVILNRLMLFSEATFKFRQLSDKKLFGNTDLAKLEKPWPNGTTGELLARMEQDVSLAGNAYIRDAGDRLERLRPDWVTIISEVTKDDNGRQVREVVGYAYQPMGDPSRDFEVFDVSEVSHWSPIPDPLANFRGMSWMTPVLREVNADFMMTGYRESFFRNSATPNIILRYPAQLTDKQKEGIRDAVAARHAGQQNAFGTMVLDAGADLTVVGDRMQGSAFSDLQAAGENRIASAAGVPAVVAGLKEGLQASRPGEYEQAMRRFADLTMRPLWRSACAALSVLVKVPDGAQLWFDTSDIAALRPGETAAADTMSKQADTANKLIMAGYEPDSILAAVTAGDLTLLKHSGMTSVQLYKPGENNSQATPDNPPPDAGTGTAAKNMGVADKNAGDVPQGDAGRAVFNPDFHPRDRKGKFTKGADILNIEMRHLSDHRVLDIFGQLSSQDNPDEAALRKVSDELDRRDAAEAARRKADPLANVDLKSVSEDRLFQLWSEHSSQPNVVGPVTAEISARRKAAEHAGRRPLVDWENNGKDTLEQRRIDKLVASGLSYPEAYAEAYALSSDKLARDERLSLVDLARRAGETRMQAVRRAYGETVSLQYLAAENAVRGHLLNAAGRNAGVDPITLFSGQASRARKWASEDLLRWWADNPRITFTQFSNEVLAGAAGRRKNQASQTAGNDKDFGV